MTDIIDFPGYTKLDIDPNEMLRAIADEGEYDKVFVVGWNQETDEITPHSNTGKVPDLLYMIEQAKLILLLGEFDDE